MSIQKKSTMVQGLRIDFLEAGEGKSHPLLLLHGGGTDSAALSWGHLLPRFAERRRVIAPDWPGYGESGRGTAPYSLPYYISILRDFIRATGIVQPSLAGISMGGGAALGYALDNPDDIHKLILVDSLGLQDRAPAHLLSYLFLRVPFLNELTWAAVSQSRAMAAASLKSIFHNPANISEELIDLVFCEMNKPNPGAAFRAFQLEEVGWKRLKTVYMESLHSLKVPTLILHGASDALVPLRYAKEAHARIPNSELIVLPGAGHWPQRERPEEVFRAISGFLDS